MSIEQAKTHIDRSEFPQAINELVKHLDTDFHDDLACFLLGAAHLQLGNYGLAAVFSRQAIEIRRHKNDHPFPEALGNLAACFKNVQKPDAAAELWQLALEKETEPTEQARFLMNLGGCYINRGTPEKALEYYDQSLALRPDLLTCVFNRAFALLELGRWEEGWKCFNSGMKSGDRKNRRYRGGDIPEWDGTPDQTVIVWGEQGIGDEILFASMLPDMIGTCKRVIFDCHPRMEDLFKRSFPEITVYGTRKTMSEIPWLDEVEPDASICISSLGEFFRNRDEDFPGKPFLKADPMVIPNGKPRIGISWKGGSKSTHQNLRSFPLEDMLPLFDAVDADWYSLQYTPDAADDVCRLQEDHGIVVHHHPGKAQCKNYDTTASFVSGLDLVITVCTAAHHLSNAIGKETWTLVPSKPAWRYGIKGELWYRDTARFFRQDDGESWEPCINRVAAALRVRHVHSEAAE